MRRQEEQNQPSRRQRHTNQEFTKGINHRIDKYEGSPDRLHRLENARIFQRGSTLSISRFEGYVVKNLFGDEGSFQDIDGEFIFTSFINHVFDMIFGPNDDLFVYYALTSGECKIRIFNTDDIDDPVQIEEFTIGNDAVIGDLVEKNDTVFITPFSKMINFFDGKYHLNEVTSAQPKIISINNPVGEVIEFPQ